MVAGPDVYICDRCINDAAGIVRSDLTTHKPTTAVTPPRRTTSGRRLSPLEIKDALDEYVVGQGRAKKALSVAVYNHYKRVEGDGFYPDFEDVELEFTEDGLDAIADQALLRATGARGLRAIMEEVLLDTMYELPGRDDVSKVVIDRAVVIDKVNPTLVPKKAPRQRKAAS